MRRAEQLGPYRYRQSDTCFPLGEDTLCLAAFAPLTPRWRVCDLGCGAGALPLLLLGREPTLAVTGLELDGADADLARANLAENGLAGEILTGDIRQIRQLLPAGAFDLVVSNPPYFPLGAGKSGGSARAEEKCTLDELCAAAGWLLKNGGRFALVYRASRLADLLAALRRHGMEPKRMQLVQHDEHTPPRTLLLEARRQGGPGLEILPTLITHGR
jgi:tRNA1Val (adenine37-N6)-methyltransferase